jgi:hypothetical protein
MASFFTRPFFPILEEVRAMRVCEGAKAGTWQVPLLGGVLGRTGIGRGIGAPFTGLTGSVDRANGGGRPFESARGLAQSRTLAAS